MVQFSTLRRSLRFPIVAVCSAAIVSFATPASARSQHGARHYARAHQLRQYVANHFRHYVERHRGFRHHGRLFARTAPGSDRRGLTRAQRFASAYASIAPRSDTTASSSTSNIVAEARRYIGGGNPTGRASLWCARFMNMVLERIGLKGTGSDMASSFASYGHRVSGPQIGAIAVMHRRGGGHVGVVSGIDADGNPIVVSGNYGNRVREAVYPRGRIYAYVMPTG
jgi:uncharacterized protein (TIGR02594 family)